MLLPTQKLVLKPLRVPRAEGRFTVRRDQTGVAHVAAERWLDALYGLGFMHARDRGTQLLFARSVASGRATEEIADTPDLWETDRFFRRIGLYRHLAEEVAAL